MPCLITAEKRLGSAGGRDSVDIASVRFGEGGLLHIACTLPVSCYETETASVRRHRLAHRAAHTTALLLVQRT